ncbi:MAG TPA: histidine phosphatase family protein [Pseudonocardiaceae bacterium]|jgi:probable phosphoglycerate mutase|nr:histidine phosphatase family protein [Pseudonocardiaceae bacterium]
MAALRLVLARHGETTANAQGLLDTRLPGHPLTEQGHRQAADLAQRLADEPVVAVYASRALRARQTAQPIATRHRLATQVLGGVHEVFIGDLEGRESPEDHRTLHELYRTWHYGDLGASRPGGESGKQVLDRYLADVAAIRRAHRHGTAVLVSHGAATRLAVVALAANVEGSFAAPRLLPNAATVLLEADGTGWRCLRWDGIDLG